jgi:hypothetical protein
LAAASMAAEANRGLSALPETPSLDYTKGLRRRRRAAPTQWGVAKR